MTDSDRPLVTFALFAYNQESIVRDAVAAALAQDYEPLEIILSDDGSTDRTLEILREMTRAYCGPHVVRINRNERNLGIGAHVNRVMEMASGEFVVVAAGDDVSLPHRTSRLVGKWVEEGRVPDLIGSSFFEVGSDGTVLAVAEGVCPHEVEPAHMARVGRPVIGCSASWTRRLWSRFGPLPEHIVNEDRVITFRAFLAGGVAYVGEPLVLRRVNGQSWLAPNVAGAEAILKRMIQLARFDRDVAEAALADLKRAERPDLEQTMQPLVWTRLLEAKMVDDAHAGQRVGARTLFQAWRAGIRVQSLLRARTATKMPWAYALFRRLKSLYYKYDY